MKKTLENTRFGIEIEVEFPNSEDSSALIRKNRVIKGWTVDYDGSLDNGAEYKPLDRTKLYYNKDSLVQIKEILALIKVHHGVIKPSCGLHIHINAQSFTNKQLINIIKHFYKQQNIIIKDFCILKNRIEDTANKWTRKEVEELTEKEVQNLRNKRTERYFNSIYGDKYKLLNIAALSLHNTLEFRLFNGTIMYRKITGHIKWAINFCLNNCTKA